MKFKMKVGVSEIEGYMQIEGEEVTTLDVKNGTHVRRLVSVTLRIGTAWDHVKMVVLARKSEFPEAPMSDLQEPLSFPIDAAQLQPLTIEDRDQAIFKIISTALRSIRTQYVLMIDDTPVLISFGYYYVTGGETEPSNKIMPKADFFRLVRN